MLPDEERRQYAARQYESLREEIGQARQAQHTILQWTQALAGTLFAAALVAGTAKTSRYLVAAQFVLGLVLPAVLLGGALAWSGELVRMTRAGVFLRSFERSSWAGGGVDPVNATSLFIWENFVWLPPKRFLAAGDRDKQNIGYAGISIFFGIMYLGSLIAFCVITPWPLAIAVSCVFVVLGAAVMLPQAVQLFMLNATSLSVTAEDLGQWMEELKKEEARPARTPRLASIVLLSQRTMRLQKMKANGK